jgi:hypothetical protein
MKNQNAIIAMLAIMSIAALAGVFSVQVADAQLPTLGVSPRGGVNVLSEELGRLSVSDTGVGLLTEEFFLGVDPTRGIEVSPR